MQTTWREQSSGEVVLECSDALGPRLFAALLFGAVGLFFFAHLVRALSAYVRSATASEWLTAIPGILIVTVLSAVPSALALYLAAGRARVVIDRVAGEIRDMRDLRFVEWGWKYPIAEVSDVRVETSVVRSRRRRKMVWAVRIHLTSRKRPVTVGYEPVTVDADALAARLREALGVAPLP